MPGTSRSGGDRTLSLDRTAQDGLPRLPEGTDEGTAAKWQELLDTIPAGMLRRLDVHLLLNLARLLVELDELSDAIAKNPVSDKLRRLRLSTVDRVQKLSGLFGLSPLDRKRGNITEDCQTKEPTDFEIWLEKGGLG